MDVDADHVVDDVLDVSHVAAMDQKKRMVQESLAQTRK